MRIVKLKYTDKAEAIEDLIAKGIYVQNEEELVFENEVVVANPKHSFSGC